MRDIRHLVRGCRLPDVAEHFAPDALPPGILTGHHSLRGREDRDAEATEDARDLLLADVDAEAGFAHAFQTGEDWLLFPRVVQVHAQVLPVPLFVHLEVLDVALGLQDFRDRPLELGCRHVHKVVTCGNGIANAC
jgi:hypothetical protein